MPANLVVFIDTSVLLNILAVPGRSDDNESVVKQLDKMIANGAKFVLPITSLIETGNFICQCSVGRREAAERYVNAVNAARSESPPWAIRDVQWDGNFIDEFLSGGGSKASLLEHFTAKTLGAGDAAILVERQQFLTKTAFTNVKIWTLDKLLKAHDPYSLDWELEFMFD